MSNVKTVVKDPKRSTVMSRLKPQFPSQQAGRDSGRVQAVIRIRSSKRWNAVRGRPGAMDEEGKPTGGKPAAVTAK